MKTASKKKLGKALDSAKFMKDQYEERIALDPYLKSHLEGVTKNKHDLIKELEKIDRGERENIKGKEKKINKKNFFLFLLLEELTEVTRPVCDKKNIHYMKIPCCLILALFGRWYILDVIN
jgi:hypothetical protein